MKKSKSELTYKVLAHSVVPNFEWDDCVDWAYEMISLGYDTPNLLMLASITKPTNHFEVLQYLIASFSELGLEQKSGEEAEIIYSYYFIRKIIVGEKLKVNLSKLMKLSYELDNYNLSEFYNLYWAFEDLEYGMEHQSYWPGATKDNIEQIVIETAQKWLKKYENQLNTITIA